MNLKDVKDKKLIEYLSGKISITELSEKMDGSEIYEIVGNKVELLSFDKMISKKTSTISLPLGKSITQDLPKILKNGVPDVNKVALATVCKKGPRFNGSHAVWLLEQACKHLKTPFRFICLTDDSDVPGSVPLIHDWRGWWSKLELFRPGLFYDGETVLYLDLDTVFIEDYCVPQAPPENDVIMVKFGGAWFTRYGSGLMVWKAPFTKPYEWFKQNPDKYMDCFASDQEVVISCVTQNGGTIHKAEKAEVQRNFGTENIPNERPNTSIFFTAGCGAKPWEANKSWIPQLKVYNPKVSDMAMIVVCYGSEKMRVAAARKGSLELSYLQEMPAAKILVELVDSEGETRLPEWAGERLEIVSNELSKDIWQKETLMNLGARHIIRKYPKISKFIFPDADVYPKPGWSKFWLHSTSDLLDRYDVAQPWRLVSEDSLDDFSYLSYSWAYATGSREINSGQGFCTAMTKKFFLECGGFPEACLSGSGDVLTILQMHKNCAISDLYVKTWNEWKKSVESYNGPKTDWGWLPCELLHASHGKRHFGDAGYRCYYFRNYIWEFVGGVREVIEKNSSGVWQWKVTPLAKAARELQRRYKELSKMEDVYRVWDECKKLEGV